MTVLVRSDTSRADLLFLLYPAYGLPSDPPVACVYSIDLARTLFSILDMFKYVSIYVARTLLQAVPVYT